jgi:hypothetical protein
MLLLYITRFAGKRPRYASLKSGRPISPIAAEWDLLAKHAAYSTGAIPPPLRKMKFELNRW